MRKRFLTTAGAAVMALGMTFSAMAADVPTDYEKYFTFDETTDDAVAVAQGAGAAVGAETEKTWTYVEGKNGKAIAINDAGDNIGLDTKVSLSGSDSFTLSFWAKATSAPFAAPVVWTGATSQGTEAWIGFWAGFNDGTWNNAAGIGSNDAAGARVGLVAPLSETQEFGFDYITLVYDASTQLGTLYYNGKSQGTTEAALPTIGDDCHVYVGANAWDAPANMVVDDLAIFKRALSEDEVAALYEVNGVPSADATKVEQEETKAAEKVTLKVSLDTPGVNKDTAAETEESSNMGIIIGVIAAVLVVAVVVAVVIASKKKKS